MGCTVSAGDLQEGLDRLKSNRIDLLLCIGYSEERARYIDFPKEFLLMDWGRIFKAKGSSIDTIIDLDGKTVTALKGSVFTSGFKALAKQFHIDVTLLEMDRVSDVLNAVTSGKAVAGVTSNLPSILNEAQFSNFGQTHIIFTPVKIGYGVNKGRNGDLVAALDRSIAGFKANEQSLYHKKLDQMMGVKEIGIPKKIYWVVSGITGALIIALVFVVILKTQVRKKTRAIIESVNKYNLIYAHQNALLSAVPDIIMQVDTHKVYTWSNRAGFEFFGDDVIGKDASFYFAGEQDTYDVVQPLYESSEKILYVESWQRRKDGEVRLLAWWCNALEDGNGTVVGTLSTARDITDQKQSAEKGLEMERKYQQTQKLASLGVLAGGIAHDFNNILNIIMGYCYIIIGDIDSGLDQKTVVKKIEAAARRASDLCRQMLTYAGKSISVHSRINLQLMVDDMLKMLQSAFKKNIGIECDFERDVPQIYGDNAQIQQVIINLIINASEAIGDRNGVIKIALNKTTVQDGQVETDFFGTIIQPGIYARLQVADNGCGMDAETQKHVFEPFYTTKFTGRGLGMSAVLGIIKSHKGSLKLTSTPRIGTTFEVYFPLTAVPVVTYNATPAGFSTGKNESGTVLLVDDEEGIRIIGSALLKAMGYSVVTATNGREALEICREQGSKIDLVLLDLLMPEMGGIETYRLLREITPVLPVVICSGCDIGDIQEEIDGDQYAALIQKPYNPVQLRDTLKKLLDTPEAP